MSKQIRNRHFLLVYIFAKKTGPNQHQSQKTNGVLPEGKLFGTLNCFWDNFCKIILAFIVEI